MSNEEIVKEIDEATNLMTEAKVKMNIALNLARGVIMKGNTVDTEAYNKGLEDAWELAQKIVCCEGDGGISQRELKKIFYSSNTCEIMCLSYFEALEKLEAYEKEQNEIKVGDVVEFECRLGVVTAIIKDKTTTVNIVRDDGFFSFCCNVNNCKKTGKHIDIQKILEQIKENEHDGE